MEKERRTKALLLSTLEVVVATVSIAFAAMSRTLSINGIGKMDTASWSVYFANLSNAKITRGAEEVGKPKISDDKGIVQDINVKLSNPKDEISYTVDIVNDGTIDAEITMIKDIELTDVQKKVFEFKVTYTDTGEILKDGDILPKKTTKNITINIKFKDDITEFDLPTESQTINLSYQITYTQYDGGNSDLPIGPDGGLTGKAALARGLTLDELWEVDDMYQAPFFNSNIGRGSVESISFVSNQNVPEEASSTVWDASEDKDESIIGWYQDTDLNNLYEVYIGSTANIYAPSDSSALFSYFTELKEINFNNFNTSEVTNMMEMFAEDTSLINLDLSSFDTSNVTDMSYMFMGPDCEDMNIEVLNLSGWDTQNVEKMNSMFGGCEKLTNLDLSSFNTSKVTDMNSMFYYCSSLTSIDVSNFNTQNVTDMGGMFNDCSSLTSIDVSNFNTQNVTDMGSMFNDCSSLTSLDLSAFDTSNLDRNYPMFQNCSSLVNLNMDGFRLDYSSPENYFFSGCTKLTTISLNNAYVETTDQLFYGAKDSLEYVSMKNAEIGGTETYRKLFKDCIKLKKVDMQGVTYMDNTQKMQELFTNCTSLNEIIISDLDLSQAASMFLFSLSDLPNNFTIYVKNEASKNIILERRSDAIVIIGAPAA